MNNVVVKCHDPQLILALEPVLEGIYYKNSPCRIFLETNPAFFTLFANHPLIAELTATPAFAEGAFIYDFDSTKNELKFSSSRGAHLVDQLTAMADVPLLRRTPSFCKYDWAPYGDSKIVFDPALGLPSFLRVPAYQPYLLSVGTMKNTLPQLLTNFERIVASDIFVGGVGSRGLPIAHAAGVKTIIGLYEDFPSAHQQSYPEIKMFHVSDEQAISNALKTAMTRSKYPEILNRGNACEGIKNYALKFCQGYGLDVGSSQWPLPGATASDENHPKFNEGPFDFVFSSHCLEHIVDWGAALKQWTECLLPGGTFFLYLPHPAMEHWRPGADWVGAHHVWGPEPVSLVKWLHENTKIKVAEYSVYPDYYWSFFIRGQKV
jgi:hypothetical protein